MLADPRPRSGVPVGIGLAGIGGLLIAAAFPPFGLPYILPLAVAVLLKATLGLRTRYALYAGLCAGMACYLPTLNWLANLFGAAMVPLCAILAAFIGLFCALTSWLHRRLPAVPLWILAPVVWVAIEFYRSEHFVLRFGWIAPAYGVVRFPAFGALAPVIGSYGITLLIVALGSSLPVLWPARKGAAFGLLAIWLALFLVPARRIVPERPMLVRLVQATCEDVPELVAQSAKRGATPADVTLWPEYSFLSDPIRDDRTLRVLQTTARQNMTWLVFGGKDWFDPSNRDRWRNTAYVMSPGGEVVGRHVKVHTVHLINDGVPGKEVRAIPTDLGRLGVGICFDMDYPDVARRLVEDGAEVFVVPNMDPAEWGPIQREQHRALFAMRAAECGRWLARADIAGGTSAYAPDGSEVARVSTSDPAQLDVTVGRSTHTTLYVRYGWLLPRLCMAGFALLVVAALLARRGRHQPSPNGQTTPAR